MTSIFYFTDVCLDYDSCMISANIPMANANFV